MWACKKKHHASRDIYLDRDDFYQEGSRDRFFLNSREYTHVTRLSPPTLLTYPAIKHNFDFDGGTLILPNFALKMRC